MGILSALYSGSLGFTRAKERMDVRAERISRVGQDADAQEHLAEDLVGMEIDKSEARANSRVVEVSSEIFHELTKLGKK